MVNPIISHRLKLVFFMIPKNASITIRRLIADNLKCELGDLANVKYNRVYHYKDYFWFTILRDPAERLVSCYYDKVLNQAGPHSNGKEFYKPLYNPKMSLKQFVDLVCMFSDNEIDWHAKSQLYYVDGYLNKMDFVGTVENIGDHIKTIKQRTRLKGEPGHFRKTNHRKADALFTTDMRMKVYRRYKGDFELYERYRK